MTPLTSNDPSIHATPARLVSFIGTGDYHIVKYTFEDQQCQETCFVALALAQFLKPAEIVIVATEEAWRKHGEKLDAELRHFGHPDPEFREIPAGRSSGELWTQFDIIKQSIRRYDGPVALDITHGFRAQPFFAAAVTAFVKAVDANPPKLSVYYAFADHSTSQAPIWDLGPFVSLLEWSQALSIFLKTGRADEAAEATEALGRVLSKLWAKAGAQGSKPTLRELGKALRAFGDDLQTLRTGNLLLGNGGRPSSSRQLHDLLVKSRPDIERHIPPLGDVLDRISSLVEPLSKERDFLEHADVAALAELYVQRGRYIEAIATVREGFINRFATEKALRPGCADFDKEERVRAEKKAAEDKFLREIAARRNDILHAQYRRSDETQDGSGSIEKVKEIVKKYDALGPATYRATHHVGPGQGKWFLNISNHPSCGWSSAQMLAAQALAPQIIDITFPDVPADADEGAVADLAEQCVRSIPCDILLLARFALVQGEFTLTVEIVKRLQKRGIVCLSASSSRNAAEFPDGMKLSQFQFERFRRYPPLVEGSTESDNTT